MYVLENKNFNLEQICESGQCFRMNPLEEEKGAFFLIAGDRFLRARQDEGRIYLDCDENDFQEFWKEYFDLDTDYGKILESIDENDVYLNPAAASCPGMRILRQPVWETIVSFIISQQNNIKRIKKSIELLCKEYGQKNEHKDGAVYYSFPEPGALCRLPEDALMSCNLGYRSKYVVRAAARVESVDFDLKLLKTLGYEDAMEYLKSLSGVGDQVANCICLFALHHIGAFPVDTHIRQILSAHYPGGFPFERYRGYAGILQQYMFYYKIHGEKDM